MKQPRTKCRTNQHQKRPVIPVFRLGSVCQDLKTVIFDHYKPVSKQVVGDLPKQKLWAALAESLGYELGSGKDLWSGKELW